MRNLFVARSMPNPEMRGIFRRLRWLIGAAVYDWDRERWVSREGGVKDKD